MGVSTTKKQNKQTNTREDQGSTRYIKPIEMRDCKKKGHTRVTTQTKLEKEWKAEKEEGEIIHLIIIHLCHSLVVVILRLGALGLGTAGLFGDDDLVDLEDGRGCFGGQFDG